MFSTDRKIQIALGIVVAILLSLVSYLANEYSTSSNQLTLQDLKIQQLNVALGISESELTTGRELNRKYKSEINGLDEELKKIIKENNLKLASRDKTIAQLKNSARGGKTEVIWIDEGKDPDPTTGGSGRDGAIISYSWTDTHRRFSLFDPNIFKNGDELFEYEQYFEVLGYVFYGKDGQLQLKNIYIKELYKDGEVFKPISNGKLTIVDSKFEYINLNIKEKKLIDVFHPRVIGGLTGNLIQDHSVNPILGLEFINLKNYIDDLGLGANVRTIIDVSNLPTGSFLNSRIGLGVSYTLLPPFADTNLGLGVSLSTPYNNFLNEWYLGIDINFYITN